MRPVFPLDRVICRVAAATQPRDLRPESKLVVFDARARKVLPRRPWLSLGRELRHYVVSTRRVPIEVRGPVCRLRSPLTRLSFDVEVSYLAHCEPGNEERLVAALHHGEHPAAAVNEFLDERVHDFEAAQARAGRDMCVEFEALVGPLKRYLAQRAAADLGLSLDPDIRPILDAQLTSVSMPNETFPVRVTDYDQELQVTLACEAEVHPDLRVRAMLHQHENGRLAECVKQAVRNVLASEFTLHAFAFEMNGRVRARLAEAVNAALHERGRRLAHLRLECPTLGPLPPGLEEIEHSVACKLRDWQEPVQVHHRLQLSLQDLGRFRGARLDSVQDWARTRLGEITRASLFDKTYLELLDDALPDEIRAPMRREAESVGYALKQLISLPELEPLSWRHGILWDDNEVTCQTRNSQVEVRVNFVVRGRITRLHDPGLQRYLTPRSRLRDDVREAIRVEAQGMLHAIEPERFYMHFEDGDAGQPPVRHQLQDAIRTMLETRFLMEDVSVVAKPLETDLTKRLSALQQGLHRLDISTLSLRDSGLQEQVPYHIIFRVSGVHPEGWHRFRAFASSEQDLENLTHLKDLLGECVRGVLDTLPTNFLQYREYRAKRDLHGLLQASADRILQELGLVIAIVEVRRETTLGEAAEQEKLLEDIEVNKVAAVKAARGSAEAKSLLLASLQHKEAKLLTEAVDADDPELLSVRRTILELRAELEAYPSLAAKQHVKPGSGGDTPVALADYLLEMPTTDRFRKQLGRPEEGEQPHDDR